MVSALITWGLLSILGSTFAVCALLILTQRWHGKHSLDHDLHGIQKIHRAPVPRVGGVGLALGLIIGALVGFLLGGKTYPVVLQLLLCATPVFLAGLMEDLTKRVSVRTRLYASFVSAGIATWLLNAYLVQLDTPVLDSMVAFTPFAIVFTCIAVGGMTHAINIIDGLNGLAAGCVAVMLAGLMAIAWQMDDILVMKLCLWGIAALLGFLLLNFPFGRIFLGDGGAYLAGFWLAECGILLLNRNPSLSAWAVLLICFYPAWETVFSMYRRHVHSHVQSGQADMAHLHQLIYWRLQSDKRHTTRPSWSAHGLASASIWCVVLLCQIIALKAKDNTAVLVTAIVIYAVGYCWLYQMLSPYRTKRGAQVSDPARVH
jgi:UDP-N-acetylmuramyl pentapeptide phosphotransferase/UDP-N-acetylglucosamine-1-phosphate transferase